LLEDSDLSAAKKVFDLRYWGAYAAAKYATPKIRAGGSIVFTSGVAGVRPHPGGWSIPASLCGAMEGLTRCLAVDLAPVRVNIVSPGLVRTPFWSNMPEAARDAMYGQMEQQLLVKHVGEAEEIADAYIYAMRQSYCTGQVIVTDGGGVLI
jgi:NAD(P)-dependent dehydrogenase (short-subunit alcohol dehydrogenase family)